MVSGVFDLVSPPQQFARTPDGYHANRFKSRLWTNAHQQLRSSGGRAKLLFPPDIKSFEWVATDLDDKAKHRLWFEAAYRKPIDGVNCFLVPLQEQDINLLYLAYDARNPNIRHVIQTAMEHYFKQAMIEEGQKLALYLGELNKQRTLRRDL